jgi:hypothetical protein
LSATCTNAVGTPMQHSSSNVTPAALTTRSAVATRAGRSRVGGCTSKPGTSAAEMACTATGTPVDRNAVNAAATAGWAAPPPITTTTVDGTARRAALAASTEARNGAYAGPRSTTGLPSSGRSDLARFASTTTSARRLPNGPSSKDTTSASVSRGPSP